MNNFKMTATEKDTLADIGKLSFFVWRAHSLKHGELSKELSVEYDEIIGHYNLKPAMYPHSQIQKFLKTLYKALHNDMRSLNRHLPIEYNIMKGSIISVKCSCGEFTKYKVPLKLLDDFQCPKENYYGAH